jgi:uncharacterized protein
MFNQHDQTYAKVPSRMSTETAMLLLDRVAEHLRATQQTRFTLILHGGEPTLWPLNSYSVLFSRISDLRREGIDIRLSVQTNAVRIPSELLRLYADAGVRLGISLDGPASYNDSYRLTHGNHGSYKLVMRTVERMQDEGFGGLIGGFLTVANRAIPPAVMLDWADTLPVRRLDILWPMEFNYDNPPWSVGQHPAYRRRPQYGEWFARVFEEWWRRDDPTLYIRSFFETILVLLGSPRHGDMLVNDRLGMFVVNTDGAVEYHDYFRSYEDGATRSPYRLQDHTLEQIAEDPLFAYCARLGDHLPAECTTCPVVRPCGGGFLPGRMKRGNAFPERRSVLCYDQFDFNKRVLELVGPHLEQSRFRPDGGDLQSPLMIRGIPD